MSEDPSKKLRPEGRGVVTGFRYQKLGPSGRGVVTYKKTPTPPRSWGLSPTCLLRESTGGV